MSNGTTKKTQGTPRPQRAKVSFSLDELERIDALTRKAGFKTRSAYIRARSLGYRPPHTSLTRFNDETLLMLHRIVRQLTGATTNLNQLAKVANTTQAVSPADLDMIARQVTAIEQQKALMVEAASHIVDMTLNDDDTP